MRLPDKRKDFDRATQRPSSGAVSYRRLHDDGLVDSSPLVCSRPYIAGLGNAGGTKWLSGREDNGKSVGIASGCRDSKLPPIANWRRNPYRCWRHWYPSLKTRCQTHW